MSDSQEEQVVLVDDGGREVGLAEKLAAHRGAGQLHLAFSVYLFDAEGRLLLQKRAAGKYHFAGRTRAVVTRDRESRLSRRESGGCTRSSGSGPRSSPCSGSVIRRAIPRAS